jgi:hypothetical protein
MSTIIQRAGEIRLGNKEPTRKNWNRYTAFMNEQYMPILINSKNRFFSRNLTSKYGSKKIMNPTPMYVQVNGNTQPVVIGQVPCMRKRNNKNCIPVSQWETFASKRKESANEFKKKHKEQIKKLKKDQKLINKLRNNLLSYANNQNHVPKARITQANLEALKKQRNNTIEGIKLYQANLMEGLTNAEKNRFIRNQLITKSTNYIQNLVNMAEKALARKKTRAPRKPRAPSVPAAPVTRVVRKPRAPRVPRLPAAPVIAMHPMNLPVATRVVRKPRAPRVPRLPAAPVVKRHPMNRPKPLDNTGCVKQTTKKYTSRKSPPYPAAKCCGQVFPGKNGLMYVSQADKKGTCRWTKIRV